ncbi:MAG TPA: 6-phosphogluconolactonase [Pyrinomonadaceae bacterium]|nr:6-phosphogluconolactonase [Pyrinomonadaceae bacterium]
MNVQIFSDPNDLARAASEHFVARSVEAVERRGLFTVALSGGSTPKLLYELLADKSAPFRDRIPWSSIHFFWSDERHVPPDHPDSNYRMANEALLSQVPVSENNVHRVLSENTDASAAAEAYESTLWGLADDGLPRLDLVLLGLGTDGHTASIFPGSEVLHETTRLVSAPWVEKLKTYRITMTLPLLNNGASVVFLVSGKEKAEIVKAVLEGPRLYPAQEINPADGELIWMLDKEAGARVNRSISHG